MKEFWWFTKESWKYNKGHRLFFLIYFPKAYYRYNKARKKDRYTGKVSPRWAFLSIFEIPDSYDKDKIYLKRLRIIQTPLFAIYLHWIYLPDRDRDPHDHPWNFVSIILKGGYKEEIVNTLSTTIPIKYNLSHRRFSSHIMRTHLAHKITKLKDETITLVLTGRRKRIWGFHTPEGFIPWNQYSNPDGTLKNGPDPFNS